MSSPDARFVKKAAFGLIRNHFGVFLTMALSFFTAVCALVAMGRTADRVALSFDGFFDSANCGDIIVEVSDARAGEIASALLEISGVADVAEEYRTSLSTLVGGRPHKLRLTGWSRECGIPCEDASSSAEGTACRVSLAYLRRFGDISTGDCIAVDGGTQMLCVEGALASPEYMDVFASAVAPASDGSLVELSLPLESLWSLTGEYETVNRARVYLKSGANADEIKARIKELQSVKLKAVYDTTDAPAAASANELVSAVTGVCGHFTPLFCLMSALFLCYCELRLLRKTRKSAAAWLGAGVPAGTVLCAYAVFAALSAFTGWLFGSLFGAVAGNIATDITVKNLALPTAAAIPVAPYSLGALLLCALPLLISSLLTLPWLWMPPSRLLRGKKRRAVARLGASPIIPALCICAATAMLCCTFHFDASLGAIGDELFVKRALCDVTVTFDDIVSSDILRQVSKLRGVVCAEPVLTGAVTLKKDGASESVRVDCIAKGARLTAVYASGGGERLSPVSDGIILTSSTARALKANTGDLVELEVFYDGVTASMACPVAGVSDQHASFTQYAALSTVTAYLNGSEYINSAQLSLRGVTNDEFRHILYESGIEGALASFTDEAQAAFFRRYSGVSPIISTVSALGFLLGFTVCANVCMDYCEANKKRLRILFAIGESRAKAARTMLAYCCAAYLPGCALGLLSGSRMGAFFLEAISTKKVAYPLSTPFEVYLLCALCCAAFIPASALLSFYRSTRDGYRQ